MPATAPIPFAAALLAGGMSRRMGQDKAMLDWNGQPLWRFQLHKLRAIHPARLFVSARQDQNLHTHDAQLVLDPIEDQGPLPAIERCLRLAAPLPLLVLAVDMPDITVDFLQIMLSHRRGIVFQSDRGFEPLCAVYPPEVLPLFARHSRLQTFAQEAVDLGLLHLEALTPSQKTAFLNLNFPADLPCKPPSLSP